LFWPQPRHSLYARHRFPTEVISLAVWLYFRFPLSLRMVEEMLAARGIEVSHETVRTFPVTPPALVRQREWSRPALTAA
jgi:putative transposase